MQYRDQQKYLDTLKRYEKKFDREEMQDYKMFLKRHKDDEDLDRLSMGKLKALYTKYYLNREKKNYDDFFKKPDEDTGSEEAG